MDQRAVIDILVIVILIFLSSFFSSAETALTAVNPVSLKALADEGNSRAALVLKILGQQSKMLSTILVFNNIVNLSSSALITTFALKYFGANAVSIATALLTIVIILFGEITPKSMATIRCQEMSMRFAPIIHLLMWVLTPVIIVIDFLSRNILRLLRVDTSQRKKITESELKTYVDVGSKDGAIEKHEKKFIYNIIDFGDSEAKDIMTPRIDMACIPEDAEYEDVISLFRQNMFTRLPVYEEDPDNIIGLINIKDLIMLKSPSEFSVRGILRDAYYTYEYKKTADLLKEMQHESYNVAFVLNEYGRTVGMITLEDLMEEIVGEIRDEYDQDEEEQIHRYDDRTFLVEGGIKLDDLNDFLGSEFNSDDYDSIAGLIIEKLERLPLNNELVTLEDGTTLQAKAIHRNRIEKVLIRFPRPIRPADDTDSDRNESDDTRLKYNTEEE